MTDDVDWLVALRDACATTSQAAVARKLGVSPAMISQALKGVYKGDNDRLQTLVEGALMARTVDCPAFGEMPKNQCVEHQSRPRQFAFVNPMYSRLYRACRSGCPFSKLPKEY